MSASRPPLSSRPAFLPDEIARREFATAFRGYDPAEVRTFLNQLSEQSSDLADRIAELQRNMQDLQARANDIELDEETVTKILGTQTAQILRSAREAASEMRTNAEEEVSRQLREAHEVTSRMRTEAETILRDRTQEAESKSEQMRSEATGFATSARASAEADSLTMRQEAEQYANSIRAAVNAEAENMRNEMAAERERMQSENEAEMAQELERARQRGRDIVDTARAEAQLLVDRTTAKQAEDLEVLIRKRKIALAQVEELRAGRQRLLKAYKMVRGTLDEVTQELTRVEDEARQAAGIAGVTAAQTNGIAQEELDTVVEAEQYSLNDDVPQSVIDLINGEGEPVTSTNDENISNQDLTDITDDAQRADENAYDNYEDEDNAQNSQQGGSGNFFDGEAAYGDDGNFTELDIRSESEQQQASGEDLPGTRRPDGQFEPADFGGYDERNLATLSRQQEVLDVEVIEETQERDGEQLRVFEDDYEESHAQQAQQRVASSFIIGESFASEDAQLDRNLAMRRDSVVTKNRPQAVRRLKRALQDEQDSVVAQLRNGTISSVTELLGSTEDQATTYQRAIVRLFRDVVRAGASSVEGARGVEPGSIDHAGTNASRGMAIELVEDLRSQLEPVLEELLSGGGQDMPDSNTLQAMVSGPYGVVKGNYLEHLVDDRIAGAFDQGVQFAR